MSDFSRAVRAEERAARDALIARYRATPPTNIGEAEDYCNALEQKISSIDVHIAAEGRDADSAWKARALATRRHSCAEVQNARTIRRVFMDAREEARRSEKNLRLYQCLLRWREGHAFDDEAMKALQQLSDKLSRARQRATRDDEGTVPDGA